MKVIIRKQFDDSVDAGVDCSKDPVIVKQADKDSCDINLILSRYGDQPDVLQMMMRQDARYGDFSDSKTYQECLGLVSVAEEQFAALPAKVRDRFGHDPLEMLKFCEDPRNADEMVKLGLAIAREGTSPSSVPAKPDKTPADAPASGGDPR